MIGLLEQKPILVNIWGGDLRLTDPDSHEELDGYLNRLSQVLGLPYCFIKTNGREMFRENELGCLTAKRVGRRNDHGWWATIAHTLSMAAAATPWMWKKGVGIGYFGSSYLAGAPTYDANNQELISAIRTKEIRFRLTDGELGRNEKVAKIVKWKRKTDAPIQLKVCWRRTAGKNCSACEKCYRTILNILSNHGDPNDFGFEVTAETLHQIKRYLETHHVGLAFWEPIQQAFLAEREYWKTRPEIAWILTIRLNSFKSLVMRVWRRIFGSK